jgi:hypothetical protein
MPRKACRIPKRPKGSFPSIHDELTLVKGKSGNKQTRKNAAKSVMRTTMNLTLRLAMANVGRLGYKTNSFEQCVSLDTTIREEEIFLMDFVDGIFEV